jgi:hypothetical protein
VDLLPAAPVWMLTLLLSTTALATSRSSGSLNQGNVPSTAQDTVDVQHVMHAFHEAVTTHDGARLAALFISEGSTWLNVLSDEAYVRAKAKSPGAEKIRLGSYRKFAEFVSSSQARLDPRHSHVHVRSDGTVASVYFDFVFLIDGKSENQGSEMWQLVKGAEGWRIVAITYSSNPQSD